MARVFVSIGSNINREYYIGRCLERLSELFGDLALSSIYESEAVGFDGAAFYNLVAGFDTDLELRALFQCLRQVEHEHDRCRNAKKFSSRTLDIDILTYDALVGEFDGVRLPRAEITENAFVLLPLAEIAGDVLHPVLGQSYQTLWAGYDQTRQNLWPVPFSWRGRQLSVSAARKNSGI